MKAIFVAGHPHAVGGAGRECWEAVKLWRSRGLPVHFIPTWHAAQGEYAPLIAAIGCEVYHCEPKVESLRTVPDLAGSIVVDFCNGEAVASVPLYRQLKCSFIHVPCMCFVASVESRIFRGHGPPAATIFQSNFQREKIESSDEFRGIEYHKETGHLIRGAFDFDDWEFNPLPHVPGEQFTFGRASRSAEDKWSSNTWPIASRIQYPFKKALMLGVGQNIHRKLGRHPDWAECLPADAIHASEFYRRLHCMFPINGGAMENWPRVGGEAMATGVPVVAQREWGWKEMIRDGETGLLGSCDEELAHQVARLAWDEDLRMHLIHNARRVLVEELANPDALWAGWKRAFESCGMDVDGAIAAAATSRRSFAGAARNRVKSRHGKASAETKARQAGKAPVGEADTDAQAADRERRQSGEAAGGRADGESRRANRSAIALAGGKVRIAGIKRRAAG